MSVIPQLTLQQIHALRQALAQTQTARAGPFEHLPLKASIPRGTRELARAAGWDAATIRLFLDVQEAARQLEAAIAAKDKTNIAKWGNRYRAFRDALEERLKSLEALPKSAQEQAARTILHRAIRQKYGAELRAAKLGGEEPPRLQRSKLPEHAVPTLLLGFARRIMEPFQGDPAQFHLFEVGRRIERGIEEARAAGRTQRVHALESLRRKVEDIKSAREPVLEPQKGLRTRRAGPLLRIRDATSLPVQIGYTALEDMSRALEQNIPGDPGKPLPENFIRAGHQVLTLPHREAGRETFLRLFDNLDVSYLDEHGKRMLRDFYRAIEAGPMDISEFRGWLKALPRQLVSGIQATLRKTLDKLVDRGAISVRRLSQKAASEREESPGVKVELPKRPTLTLREEPPTLEQPPKAAPEPRGPYIGKGLSPEEMAKALKREREIVMKGLRAEAIVQRILREGREPITPKEKRAFKDYKPYVKWKEARLGLGEPYEKPKKKQRPRSTYDFGGPYYTGGRPISDDITRQLEREAEGRVKRSKRETSPLVRMLEEEEREIQPKGIRILQGVLKALTPGPEAPAYSLEQHSKLVRDILRGKIKELDKIHVSGAVAFVPPHLLMEAYRKYTLPAVFKRVMRLSPTRKIPSRDVHEAAESIPGAYFLLGAGSKLPDQTVLEAARIGWYDKRSKIAGVLRAAYTVYTGTREAVDAAAQVIRRVLRHEKYSKILSQTGRKFLNSIVKNPHSQESRAALSAIAMGAHPREQARELFKVTGDIGYYTRALKNVAEVMRHEVSQYVPSEHPRDLRGWARFYAAVMTPATAFPRSHAISPMLPIDTRQYVRIQDVGLPPMPALTDASEFVETIFETLPPTARREIPQVARAIAETFNETLRRAYGQGSVVQNRLLTSYDVDLLTMLLKNPDFLRDFLATPSITTSTFRALLSGRIPVRRGTFGSSETQLITPLMAIGRAFERIVREYDPKLKFGKEALKNIRNAVTTMANNAGITGLKVIHGKGTDGKMHYAISFTGDPYETAETFSSFLPMAIFHRLVPALALYAQRASGNVASKDEMATVLRNVDAQIKNYFAQRRQQQRVGAPRNPAEAAEHFAVLLADALRSKDRTAEAEIMKAILKYVNDPRKQLGANEARRFKFTVRWKASQMLKAGDLALPVSLAEDQIIYPPVRGSAG